MNQNRSLKRISPEEAENYISCNEDQLNTPASFFTLTPSNSLFYSSEEGWEDVTYYTNRPRHIKIPKGILDTRSLLMH